MLSAPVAPSGVEKSCSTAAADSPLRSNFLMITSAAASPWSSGARVAIRISSGMSAVKAWDDSTMHRSIPAILTKRMTHRPRNEPWARSTSAIRSCEDPPPRSGSGPSAPDTRGSSPAGLDV